MGFGRDVRKAQQDHSWSDDRPRARNWGTMTAQSRAVMTRGDSRSAARKAAAAARAVARRARGKK